MNMVGMCEITAASNFVDSFVAASINFFGLSFESSMRSSSDRLPMLSSQVFWLRGVDEKSIGLGTMHIKPCALKLPVANDRRLMTAPSRSSLSRDRAGTDFDNWDDFPLSLRFEPPTTELDDLIFFMNPMVILFVCGSSMKILKCTIGDVR